MEIEFQHWLNVLIDKYWDVDQDEWTDISEWDTEDLVDLEIIANGELQRRGAHEQAVRTH